MRFVAIGCTHCSLHEINVPNGDVLLIAGDATFRGSISEMAMFAQDLKRLPHPIKIFVPGNHDWLGQLNPVMAKNILDCCHYLDDSGVVIDPSRKTASAVDASSWPPAENGKAAVRIWGSPWQPEFNRWAFNLQRKSVELKRHWDLIPSDTDILLTHCPPHGKLDWVVDTKEHAGCELLAEAVHRVRPAYHVFAHIHQGYGRTTGGGMTFINCSIMNESYDPVNAPCTFEYPNPK